jgi:hypothetical protein
MINTIAIKLKIKIFSGMLFVLSVQLFAQVENITIANKVNDDQSIDFTYTKEMAGSYYVHMEFLNISNCYTTEYKGVVMDRVGTILTLKPANPQQGIGYSYKYRFIRGVPNPKIDEAFQYVLPFKIGKKVQIFEAGSIEEKYFGQEKNENRKSYVVLLKKSDTIFCMRKGIVVKLINEYVDDMPTTTQYTNKRNSVTIEHEDGTLANYEGFQKDSFKVKLGQTVYPYTEIGLVSLFDKTENSYRLDFNVYYLSNVNNLESDQYQSVHNYKSRYKFITPKFFSSDGIVTIETTKSYKSVFNDAIILQEMSRSEKKKYLKDPTQFK